MSNAVLNITIFRTAGLPVKYTTMDHEDINVARREFHKILSNNQNITIGDADDAGFLLIPARAITGIQVREDDPEEERRKAEEKQRAELRSVPVQRRLPSD